MAKQKQPKIDSLNDLYQFFRDIPKKNWTNGWTSTDTVVKDGKEVEIPQYCAVGHLRAAFGAPENVSDDYTPAAKKVASVLSKLYLTSDDLITRNDNVTVSGPKENVLKFVKRQVKNAAKKPVKKPTTKKKKKK